MGGGVLSKIMPARAAATPVRVVVDIDKLISERVGFVWRGKTYPIEAVTTEQFMRMADVLGEIQTLIKAQSEGAKTSEESIYEAYHRYISVLCPSFTMDELRKMPIPGLHAILNLIIKHATGQPMNMDEWMEKKKMMPAHTS